MVCGRTPTRFARLAAAGFRKGAQDDVEAGLELVGVVEARSDELALDGGEVRVRIGHGGQHLLGHRRHLLGRAEGQGRLLEREAVDVAVEQVVDADRPAAVEAGAKEDADHRVVVAERRRAGLRARLHQPDRPRVPPQRRMGRDGAPAHRVAPVARISRHLDLGEDAVDEPVEHLLLVADVPVQRHRLDTQPRADARHRDRSQAALVGQLERGVQHLLAAHPGLAARPVRTASLLHA